MPQRDRLAGLERQRELRSVSSNDLPAEQVRREEAVAAGVPVGGEARDSTDGPASAMVTGSSPPCRCSIVQRPRVPQTASPFRPSLLV